jgi:hypothetical protein
VNTKAKWRKKLKNKGEKGCGKDRNEETKEN